MLRKTSYTIIIFAPPSISGNRSTRQLYRSRQYSGCRAAADAAVAARIFVCVRPSVFFCRGTRKNSTEFQHACSRMLDGARLRTFDRRNGRSQRHIWVFFLPFLLLLFRLSMLGVLCGCGGSRCVCAGWQGWIRMGWSICAIERRLFPLSCSTWCRCYWGTVNCPERFAGWNRRRFMLLSYVLVCTTSYWWSK